MKWTGPANLAAAKANLAKLENGYRPQEIKEAEAQVGKTKADLDNKKIEFERYENLLRRKVVAPQTRDKFQADYLMAQEAYKSARAELSLRREGFRVEDIDQAREQYKAAQAALALALTRLGYATSPPSPGERRGPGAPHGAGHDRGGGLPGAHPGGSGQHLFEGYIPETDLAKVKFGMKAEITTDSSPGKKISAGSPSSTPRPSSPPRPWRPTRSGSPWCTAPRSGPKTSITT